MSAELLWWKRTFVRKHLYFEQKLFWQAAVEIIDVCIWEIEINPRV